MRGGRLKVLSSTDERSHVPPEVGKAASLGVLSVHFEGGRCRVRCPFCYLGQRSGASDEAAPLSGLGGIDGIDLGLMETALRTLSYRELAVTLSEPIEPVLEPLGRLVRVAGERGLLAAVTTTLAVSQQLPDAALSGVGRLNLSVDPWKGQVAAPKGSVEAADVATALASLRRRSQAELVLIVTLSTQRFAEELLEKDGLLGALLALPDVDRVALNALKPPPPWCDRAFWLRTTARLGPLLRQHLDRRLFLDCYVAARILGLGDCPARPDLSPAPGVGAGGVAFRSCVYQPAPDFVAGTSDELADRLRAFTVPAVCPFPIR